MKLEKLHEMWATDCKINPQDVVGASINTPMLHAKYLQMYSNARSRLVYLEMQQKKLLKKKWLYYNGKMSREEIDAEGWDYDPFNGLKILKGDMEHYYNTDEDIQKSEIEIKYQKEVIDVLKEIVDTLKWRHQTIGNIIKWRQFEAGN